MHAKPEDVLTLASFLADPSPKTVELAKNQLKKLLLGSPSSRPLLESIREPELVHPVQNFLEEFHMDALEADFRELGKKGTQLDLERGCVLLSRFAYPQLGDTEIAQHLDGLADELDEILDAAESSEEESLERMRHYLFYTKKFRGNTKHFYDPDNSFLNRVLERRMGIPISLSCVYLLIGQRLDLPVHGIGLPGHFIIGHEVGKQMIYLDPFNEGRILSKDDCDAIIRRQGLAPRKEYYDRTPPAQILSRMIVNIINIYTEQGLRQRMEQLTHLLHALQGV